MMQSASRLTLLAAVALLGSGSPARASAFDDASYARVLDQYVDEAGFVDYEGLSAGNVDVCSIPSDGTCSAGSSRSGPFSFLLLLLSLAAVRRRRN